jgi:hypothetical protein
MGMLLTEAKNFERVIGQHNAASWDSPDAVDMYMARLMEAAETVMRALPRRSSDPDAAVPDS